LYEAVGESVDDPTLVNPKVASVASALERDASATVSNAAASVASASRRTIRAYRDRSRGACRGT
jgi:hypothetical protein